MRRARLWASLVLALSTVARADEPRTLTLRYERSDTAAAGLRVRITDGKTRRASLAVSDARGEIVVRAASPELRVEDPVARVVLVERALPIAGVVQVPAAIRVHGAAPPGVKRIRVGSGARVSAGDRWSATHDARPLGAAEELPFGITLPPSAQSWTSVEVRGGRFTSGWIAASAAPQLVAVDGKGRVAIAEVKLPDQLAPHATVEAGPLALEEVTSLDVHVAAPGAPRASFWLAVADATFAADTRDAIARHLSVLDQLDPEAFSLLVLGLPRAVRTDGTLRLARLPRFATLDVHVADPFSSAGAAQRVSLTPGATAHVKLTIDQYAGRSKERRAFTGKLVVEGGAPVANATLVLNDYPDRVETKTDTIGSFRLEGVRFDRPATLFVDARKTAPEGAARTFIFRHVELKDGMLLTLPRIAKAPEIAEPPPPKAKLSRAPNATEEPTCSSPTTMDGYPTWTAILGGNVVPPERYRTGTISGNGMAPITVDAAGDWSFIYWKSPFWVMTGAAHYDAAGFHWVTMTSPTPFAESAWFSVQRPNGATVAGANVYLESDADYGLDPFQQVTSDQGGFLVRCVNVSAINAFVLSPEGWFDDTVQIRYTQRGVGAIIVLNTLGTGP